MNEQRSDIYKRITPYLFEDEELIWYDRPYKSVKYRPHIFTAIFSLFWCGFAVFWTVTASAVGGAFGLFGLPFVAVGIFLLYNVFVGEGKKMQNTVYAVTDRRAIIIGKDLHGDSFTEFVFANIQTVNLMNVRDNTGTICFVPSLMYVNHPRFRNTSNMPGQEHYKSSFVMIDDVHNVHRIISEQIMNNK